MIVDDARVSRLICRVAERFAMSFRAISKTGDTRAAHKKSGADVILPDPGPYGTQEKYVLRTPAEQHSTVANLLTSADPDQTGRLNKLGASPGLNMLDVLPNIFAVDTLKQGFISMFQRSGKFNPDQEIRAGNIK